MALIECQSCGANINPSTVFCHDQCPHCQDDIYAGEREDAWDREKEDRDMEQDDV